jgi:hypothetical protein
MKTITTTVYNFDELSDKAKEKAREWYRDGGFDYEWYDGVFDDAKTIGKLIGIDIKDIHFSGFWSQGDGACFEGTYSYAKNSVKAIKEYAPKDTELHRIVRELADIQRKYFYQIYVAVKHSGHYYHSRSTEIEVELNDFDYQNAPTKVHDIITELLRDFMNWIYRQLETEYEYLNSDEQVDETIKANEYTFDKDGNREG